MASLPPESFRTCFLTMSNAASNAATTSRSSAQTLGAPALFASPLYMACQKKTPTVLELNTFEAGAVPLITVFGVGVASKTSAVQAESEYTLYVIVPPAVGVTPERAA